MDGERTSWLKLNMVSGLLPADFGLLVRSFGTASGVFKASSRALKDVLDKESVIEKIKNFSDYYDIDAELRLVEGRNVKIFILPDDDYPESLRDISDPPPVLYVDGEIHPVDRASVAVVGSRRATPYGVMVAEKISSQLAERGITVISGFALGIDSAAHKGALANCGRTLASLGCGLNRNYPASNYRLGRRIVENGALISEFPMRTEPLPFNFPRRNRIISGLSLGACVVEAAERSGALLTANIALEQNREVFAVPGNINSKYSRGANELIKAGAKLVNCCQDIIDELEPKLKQLGLSLKVESPRAPQPENDAEKSLCEILAGQPKAIDEIICLKRESPDKVMALLSMMELKGLVRQFPGKVFTLAHDRVVEEKK